MKKLNNKPFHINLLPILVVSASISVGLGSGGLWFAVLIGATVIHALRNPLLFIQSFSKLTSVVLIFFFYFLYSILVVDEQVTASPINILSWPMLTVLLVSLYREHGIEYFRRGLLQLNIVLLGTALWGIVESVTKKNVLVDVYEYILAAWRMGTSSYRTSAIFGHPVPFSHMLILGLVISVIMIGSRWKKVLFTTVFLGALIGTQTRGAWVVVGVLLLVAILFSMRGQKISRLLLLIAITVSLAIGVYFIATADHSPDSVFFGLAERFQGLGFDDISYGQRTGSISYIIGVFLEDSDLLQLLFGHGLSMSNSEIASTTIVLSNMMTVDNGWLSILFDFGIVFFCCFLTTVVLALVRWLRLYRVDVVFQVCGYFLVADLMYMNLYSFTMWKGSQVMLILPIVVLLMSGSTKSLRRPSSRFLSSDVIRGR